MTDREIHCQDQSACIDENDTSVSSSKGLENLEISSGKLVLIDQFMLANEQFLSRLSFQRDDSNELQDLVEKFGGCILSVNPGTYLVYRNPVETTIVLAHQPALENGDLSLTGEKGYCSVAEEFDFAPILKAKGRNEPLCHVFVDTRCLVFLDTNLLFDQPLLHEYKSLRRQGMDKRARDLLRSKGAAVRYGFNRYGDELGVFFIEQGKLIALWPDIPD